jgi:hypothetical protein
LRKICCSHLQGRRINHKRKGGTYRGIRKGKRTASGQGKQWPLKEGGGVIQLFSPLIFGLAQFRSNHLPLAHLQPLSYFHHFIEDTYI